MHILRLINIIEVCSAKLPSIYRKLITCVQVEEHSKFTGNKCKKWQFECTCTYKCFRGHATKVLAKASTH